MFRGADTEEAALRWMCQQGLRLVTRNYRCRGGELDLVMLDAAVLVVIEVRRRRHPGFAGAAESVDARKRARLIHATSLFLAAHPEHARRIVRFDVLAYGKSETPEWIRSAFDA